MEPFLKTVASHLYSKYGDDIQEVCLLFPGQRAGVFFMRYFSALVKGKPIWLPPVRTISELISDLSKLQVVDPLILLFELYKVYNSIRNSEESFDLFFPFGEMLLNDFDDIDKYLVNTKQIFQNISDLKDIDTSFALTAEQIETIQQFWKNITLYEPGPVKRDFIGIWNQLLPIYNQYIDILKKKGIAYEGMIYREVCEKIKTGDILEMPYKRYAIIGFNALNESEKVFFSYLQNNKLADFYWDYDQYFVQNTWHEAGYFIRDNLEKFPNSLPPSLFSNLTGEKKIQIISVSSDVGQVKILPEIIGNTETSDVNLNDTVIVLADEQLLVPVLSSLPEPIKDVNVSLGYPFRLTPVFSFLESLMALQKNSRKMGGIIKFYHRDIQAILNHPFLQIVAGDDCRELQQYILSNNRVFMSSEELSKNSYLKSIFFTTTLAREYVDYIIQTGSEIINGLHELLPEDNRRDFQLDYWFTFLTGVNRLKEIMDHESFEFGLPILFRLLRKIASGLSIPFKGEPLAGLQVMGVLETRAIDFSKVILLSANEGIFPKTEAAVSYIPYNLRKGFGLPTIEHQDAIFAFYFYRLLQRAKDITITYNSQPSNRSGEMSRYLYQLKYENAFTVEERSVGFSISLSDEKEIIIPKSNEIVDYLQIFTPNAENFRLLTPTALSAYMECSLRFYFRYIAKIKEKEEITEDIEGSVFGKLLHFSMEWLYKPYVGQVITENIFASINNKETINQAIMQAFGTVYFKTGSDKEILHGKSIIIKEILYKYVVEILQKDKRNIPFTIISLEENYKLVLDVDGISVNVGGVVDRIDQVNGAIRIIDYKTGSVEFSCPATPVLFDREGDTGRYSAIFQSMLYALVVKSQSQFSSFPVYPGLYGLRKIFSNDFDCTISINKSKIENIEDYKTEYSTGLSEVLKEIFNTSVPFEKTRDPKKCENCSYRQICDR